MSAADVELVQAVLSRFGGRIDERLLDFMHDDCEIVPLRAALEDIVYRGSGSVRRFLEDSEESWSDLRVEMNEVRDVGRYVLVLGRLRATARSSGVDVDAEVGLLIQVREGKTSSLRTFRDPAEAVAAAENA